MFGVFKRFFRKLFKRKKHISLGVYGPPNTGKTTLANKISLDLTGEEMGTVSEIPHETRTVQKKEKVVLKYNGKNITMNLLDMPGIATKVDYKEFMKHGLSDGEAKNRSKEATRGIVEAIKWLDNVDACLVVLDSTQNPYTQVNVTILGNLEAKNIPIIIVANKIDLKKSDPDRIRDAFPQYHFVPISAKEGENIDKLYEEIINKLT
jgi:GTP-binding protein Era